MKKLITLALVSLFIGMSFNAQAQAKNTEAKEAAMAYAEAIELNTEQTTQLQSILQDFYKDSKANKMNNAEDAGAAKELQQELFMDADARIKALLNEDQMTVYNEKKAELKKKVLQHYLEHQTEIK